MVARSSLEDVQSLQEAMKTEMKRSIHNRSLGLIVLVLLYEKQQGSVMWNGNMRLDKVQSCLQLATDF